MLPPLQVPNAAAPAMQPLLPLYTGQTEAACSQNNQQRQLQTHIPESVAISSGCQADVAPPQTSQPSDEHRFGTDPQGCSQHVQARHAATTVAANLRIASEKGTGASSLNAQQSGTDCLPAKAVNRQSLTSSATVLQQQQPLVAAASIGQKDPEQPTAVTPACNLMQQLPRQTAAQTVQRPLLVAQAGSSRHTAANPADMTCSTAIALDGRPAGHSSDTMQLASNASSSPSLSQAVDQPVAGAPALREANCRPSRLNAVRPNKTSSASFREFGHRADPAGPSRGRTSRVAPASCDSPTRAADPAQSSKGRATRNPPTCTSPQHLQGPGEAMQASEPTHRAKRQCRQRTAAIVDTASEEEDSHITHSNSRPPPSSLPDDFALADRSSIPAPRSRPARLRRAAQAAPAEAFVPGDEGLSSDMAGDSGDGASNSSDDEPKALSGSHAEQAGINSPSAPAARAKRRTGQTAGARKRGAVKPAQVCSVITEMHLALATSRSRLVQMMEH